jgi:conjugative relaxase-like TrwC/TraI family protein
MLRVTPSVSVAAAKSYYTKSLSREEYYSQDQEIVGQWFGKAADKLGLRGQVQQAQFEALCDNINPATGKKLTARTKSNRRVGYDLNFHCPKSVSLVYAHTKDDTILSAFRESVRETMQELEVEMQTRVRQNKKDEDRMTGNMVWAEFVHFTARPAEENLVPDPHLHSHCYVFNATHDPEENKWKAGQFGAIKKDAPYYEAVFHARMANRLRNLGYGIERTDKGWEIAGVSRELIEQFSKRTAKIEKEAREKGITDPKQKDALGARNRVGKHLGTPFDELRQVWVSQMNQTELQALNSARHEVIPSRTVDSRQAMSYAVDHVFERCSVATDRQIMAEALRYGVGSVTVEEIRASFDAQNFITGKRDGHVLATTDDVLREEKAMIDFTRDGRGECRPFYPDEYKFKNTRLNNGQKNAVLHVLRSRDRVTGIRGSAGVGKTTLMTEAATALEETGKRVFTFAPTSEASRGVLRSEGFKNADTVQRLIVDKNFQAELKNQIIWIDEAGLLSAKSMNQVFQVAAKQNARVILSGDYYQHGSVERGDAMRILEQQAGLRSAIVSEIKRQQGKYKEAVEDLAKGDIEAGFEKLDRMGVIKEIKSEERHEQLAMDYLKAIRQGKTALVVSPTHKEGDKVTALIRAELKKDWAVGKEDREVFQQKNLNFTEAQKTDPKNYKPGMVLQLNQNIGGLIYGVRAKGLDIRTKRLNHLVRGEKLTVMEVNEQGEMLVKRQNGNLAGISLKHSKKFQVYEAKTIPLATGDRIRITQNGTTLDNHRLNSGALYQVKDFTSGGNIILNNDWVLPKDYGNLAHGYCSTSYSAQGKTVDQVFVAQSAESGLAASREQFYVSVSRGREKVTIYTDGKSMLKEAIRGSGARLSATELASSKKQQKQSGKQFKAAFLVNRLAAYLSLFSRNTKSAILNKYGRAADYAQERLHNLQWEYQRER